MREKRKGGAVKERRQGREIEKNKKRMERKEDYRKTGWKGGRELMRAGLRKEGGNK